MYFECKNVGVFTFRKIWSFLASWVSPCCVLNDGGTQRRDVAGGTGVSLPVTRDSGPVCVGASVLGISGIPHSDSRSVSLLIGAFIVSIVFCITFSGCSSMLQKNKKKKVFIRQNCNKLAINFNFFFVFCLQIKKKIWLIINFFW